MPTRKFADSRFERARLARALVGGSSCDYVNNSLLAALSSRYCPDWISLLNPIQVEAGQVVCVPNGFLTQLFFPTTAIISLVYGLDDGATTEVAVVGNEGMLGLPLITGDSWAHTRAVVQSPGHCLTLDASKLKDEIKPSSPALQLFLRYTQAMIVQISLLAVCNRHHSVYQQVSRRILMTLDRSRGNELRMTHESLALMLGVRREGVTLAAMALQKANIIHYARGRITVLDRGGLEAASCECYSVVRREYGRVVRAAESECDLRLRL